MAITPARTGITDESANLETITEAGHGFSVGNCVRFDGAKWTLAQATSAANAGDGKRVGLVDTVVDANNFKIRYGGDLASAAHGLTVGNEFYLSAGSAGALVDTAPSTAGQVVLKLGFVRDANTLAVDIDNGRVIEA